MSGGWYFAEQPDPLPPPVGTPAPVPTPDVPSGDFAVAAKPASSPDQQSDKESYLHVDLSAVPSGSTLSALTVKLKEDAAGGNLNASAAVIEAHPVTAFFADGAAGNPYSQRPKFDTSSTAKGTRGDDGTWTFDLSNLVQGKDVSTLYGFAMVPAPKSTGDGFEVVWSGKDAAASYTVASGTNPSGSGSSFLAPPPASGSGSANTTATGTGSSTSGGTSSSSGSSTSSGGTASFSSGGSSSGGSVASPTAAATETSQAAPATPATGGGQAAPAAATKPAGSKHGLPWVFIPAALAVLGLLGGAGVALGRAGEPVPPREGSVVRRLERSVDAPA